MVLFDIGGLIASLGIGIFILLLVLTLLIQIFSLKIGIQAVKGKKTSMGSVFITALINFVVITICLFIPFVGWLISIIFGLVIIKSRHDTTFFGALGAVIISWLVLVLILIIIGLTFDLSIWGLLELLA